jgi:hypothetical protein
VQYMRFSPNPGNWMDVSLRPSARRSSVAGIITHGMIEDRVCADAQGEKDGGQNLEYAISGAQNNSFMAAVHTNWMNRMIIVQRRIVGTILARVSLCVSVS